MSDVILGSPPPPLREPWRSCPGTPSPHSERKAPGLRLSSSLTVTSHPLQDSLFSLLEGPHLPLPPLPTAKSLGSLLKLSDTLQESPGHGKVAACSNWLRFNKTHLPSSMLALRPLGRDHRGSCPLQPLRRDSRRALESSPGVGLSWLWRTITSALLATWEPGHAGARVQSPSRL